MSFVTAASDAIRYSLSICQEAGEFDIAATIMIEFMAAFEMTDKEMIEALNMASGNSKMEDDAIDSIISRILES